MTVVVTTRPASVFVSSTTVMVLSSSVRLTSWAKPAIGMIMQAAEIKINNFFMGSEYFQIIIVI